MTKIQKINLIGAILLLGFAISAYTHYVICGAYLQMGYPHNTFLFIPDDKFNDFFNVLMLVKDRGVYLHDSAYSTNPMLVANYFPFSYIFMYGISLLGKIWKSLPFAIYLATFVLMMLYLSYKLLWKDEKYNLHTIILSIGIGFFTYPFLYCIDRGNIESFVFIFMCFFFFAFLKERYKTAAIFISLATAMKFYPFILAILLIKTKQYKACFLAVITTILISIVSLISLHGSVLDNFNGMIREMGHFTNLYIFQFHNGITFFALGHLIGSFFSSALDVSTEYIIFNIFAVLVMVLVLFYILQYENEFWKQVFLLVSAYILLMGASYIYKLVPLVAVMFFFINSSRASIYDNRYCILFAVLFIPKQLYEFGKIADIFHILVISYISFLIIKERIYSLNNIQS